MPSLSSPPSALPPAPRAASSAHGEPRPTAAADDNLALFEKLVAMVRRYHVFAPQTEKNLGTRWDDALPRLRAEFAAARAPDALKVALWHFGNSLHDVHCQFRAKSRGDRLRLGFRVGVEKRGNDFDYYVERVSDAVAKGALVPGDRVVSVDGIPASKLLEAHELWSNMNSRDNIALDVAQLLTSRRTSTSATREGATSVWVVQPRAGGEPKTLSVAWKMARSNDDGDTALDYATEDCVNEDPKAYGPYTMTARGYRLCIYTSTAPKYRDYPIVRQVSFRYDELPHGPLADHELLRTTFAKSKPKGVILDVQDNGGGINPNLFLEWWTDKPYEDTYTHMVLDDVLGRGADGPANISSMNDAVRDWYAAELARPGSAPPGHEPRISSARPFMCKATTCAWNNRYVPKHRVTPAPVALLLGPGCASSCDALAWHFDKHDLGPIVGRAPMAGFTTHRARFDVVRKDGEAPLGTLDLAISYDTAPGETESIEGTYVNIDVPIARTFENFRRYDALLVDGAIRALRPANP